MKLNETFEAISLLVVLVTLLFNYYVRKADCFINDNLANIKTNKDKLNALRKDLIPFMLYNWLFSVVLLSIIVCWVIIPDAIKIITTYTFHIINFNTIPTIYVLVTLYLMIFAFLSIIKLYRLNKKRLDINKRIKELK